MSASPYSIKQCDGVKTLYCGKLVLYGAKQAAYVDKQIIDAAVSKRCQLFRYDLCYKSGSSAGIYDIPMTQVVLQPIETTSGVDQYRLSWNLLKANPVSVSAVSKKSNADYEKMIRELRDNMKKVIVVLNEEISSLKARVTELEKKLNK